MKNIWVILAAIFFLSGSAHAGTDDAAVLRNAFSGPSHKVSKLKEKLEKIGFVQSLMFDAEGRYSAVEAKGDLNGDKIKDLVLLVHRDSDEEPLYLHQTVLVFKGIPTNRSVRYSLWEVGGRHFVESSKYLIEKDDVAGLEIKNGRLEITSSLAQSMGSWFSFGCTQTWKNGNQGLRLIKLSKYKVDRKSACGSDSEEDFLTGVEIVTNDCDENGKQIEEATPETTTKESRTILWKDFVYDNMCYFDGKDS